MRIVLFSDTHGLHGRITVPNGDILLFAGDMSHCRNGRDVSEFNRFLGSLPHRHKIVIGGNHDYQLATDPARARLLLTEAVYLLDESVVVGGITIYGAPWQPVFNDHACDAFALPRGRALKAKWDMIPAGVDILLTHTPPAGILDQDGFISNGCSDLTEVVAARRPRYHVFGHIHDCHGMIKHGATISINCNVQGENGALRSPLLLDYDTGEILEGWRP